MEKASTPSTNRLTRSAAKNTPRKLDQEEILDHSAAEDVKHNLRKSSRKVEIKPKTNGDDSHSLDNRKLKTVEEMGDGNSVDGFNSEDSNSSMKQSSPTPENNKSSPLISRRSLRVRRSITPGPELNSSVMKRSTSEGKLSTPNTRRTSRAKSESKDFVFTPSKTKSNDSEASNSMVESNSKHTRRKSTFKVIDKIDEEESNSDVLEQQCDIKQKSADLTTKSNSPHNIKIDHIFEEESNLDELGQQSDPKLKPLDSTNKSDTPHKTKILNDVSAHSEDNSLPLNASEILKEPLHDKSPLSKINKSNTEEEMNLEISQSFEEVSVSLAQETSNQSKISQLSDAKEYKSKMETCKSTGKDSLGEFKLLAVSQESVVQEDGYNMDTCEGTETEVVEKSNDLAKDNSETAKMDVVSESTGVEETVSELNDKPNLPLITGMDQKDAPGKTDTPKKVSEATSVVDETYNAMVFENNNIDSMIVIEETESVNDMISEASAETTSPSRVRNETSFVEGNNLENNSPVDNKSITICNLSSDKLNNDSEVSRIENGGTFNSDETTDLDTTCLEKQMEDCCKQIESLENDTSKHNKDSEINRIENDECFISDETTVFDALCPEKKAVYDQIKSPENDTSKRHSSAIDSDKFKDNVASVVIEDSNSNSAGSAGKDVSENLAPREEIFIQEIQEESIEKADLNVIVEPVNDEVTQPSKSVPVENTVEEDKSMLMQNINRTVEDDKKELTKIISDYSITGSCENNKISQINLVQQQMTKEVYENDFYERKTTEVEDDNSGSDSDIYKGLSDYGSDGDDKLKNGKGIQFDETMSSEPRSVESGEEYASSDNGNDYEEEEGEEEEEDGEEEEEIVREENVTEHDTLIKDEKNIQTSNGTGSGNPSGADSPMTYDKALAILNENREKKIDDEEFFDMFTQELNRVSEESGSDSDIAIVDEYIMDPDEGEAKKTSSNKKSNIHPNVKQLQRPAPPPSVPLSQSFPLPDQYAAAYNQQSPPVSRMNFTHGGVYNPYSQGMPAMHNGRVLYEQYASNIPNPRVFDPLEATYSGAQMFNNTLDPQMCFSGRPPLKVRSIMAMNSSQPSNVMNANYAGPSQSAKTLEISANDTDGPGERLGPLKAAELGKEEEGSQSSQASRDTEEAVSSPILELLGLDREKLRLLKQVLGLGNKAVQSATRKQLKKMNIPKRLIKTRHRAKRVKPRRQKEIVKRIINSSFKTSIEHSSEGESASSRSSHCTLFKTFKPKIETPSSVETLKSGNREVNLEDGNVSVTINTRRRTKARNRARGKNQKRARSTSSNSSEAGFKLIRKCKQAVGSTSESDTNVKPRKMTRKTVQNKKSSQKSHILKSKSGTFTVDPLTATSLSSDDAESLAAGPSMFLEEMRRSVKSNAASGKNRLSNLFSQHSPQKARASKSSDGEIFNSKRKQKVKKSQKLPADFLEKLAKDERKLKRELSESGSEEVAEKPPRKIRKKSSKVKIKSALVEQDYIPLVTGGGATQFSLARLDRYNTMSAAEQVAQLRAAHLYGPNVQRITILDFKG